MRPSNAAHWLCQVGREDRGERVEREGSGEKTEKAARASYTCIGEHWPEGRPRPRAPRGLSPHRTGVVMAPGARLFLPPSAERDAALVEAMAAALVADFLEQFRGDGLVPVGNGPSDRSET